MQSQWVEIVPEMREGFLNLKSCELDGMVPKELQGAQYWKHGCLRGKFPTQKRLLGSSCFSGEKLYFLSSRPDVSQRAPSPFQGSFLIESPREAGSKSLILVPACELALEVFLCVQASDKD